MIVPRKHFWWNGGTEGLGPNCDELCVPQQTYNGPIFFSRTPRLWDRARTQRPIKVSNFKRRKFELCLLGEVLQHLHRKIL